MKVKKEIQERIEFAIKKIKHQYLVDDNNIPWLIGYSGGKDSTCASQLVFKALIDLKTEGYILKRPIYIFSSDTMIENPLVKEIVEENLSLINNKALNLDLPIEAISLKPEVQKTFWVNVIGRGYPTPNTMFRWCTDRLKIDPANNFIHRFIDKNGEVIMVLGVREGESGTRDRVLKKHSIEGELLMKHTTLTNAYVFPPIKHLEMVDVFTYLAAYDSPWDSDNKKLYNFYEESGGGDCPMFLSNEEKTSSNSCGNSRMGCWVCTVVSKDKSLSGFIQTGLYDYLKPLLNFRNWIVTIRDDDNYRCHYRNNGSIYTKKIEKKKDSNGNLYLSAPKKGDRDKIIIYIKEDGTLIDDNNIEYPVVDMDKFSEYLKANNLTFKSNELGKLILHDHITNDYFKLGVGPYTDDAKKEIFERLISTEYEFNKDSRVNTLLITDEEILEIKKLWKKNSLDIKFIDDTLKKYNRKSVYFIQDSFDRTNDKYSSELKKMIKKQGLEFEVLNRLVMKERELLVKENREEIMNEISSIFNADKRNY